MEYLRPPRPGGAPDLPLFHLSRADGSPGDFYHPPASRLALATRAAVLFIFGTVLQRAKV